jgi:UDP-N-acetylglucosamine--N-acetylmuramyl-(pentapeptide) pyrophosphoryl-undecaprenol N-acetylglucosamine transferase
MVLLPLRGSGTRGDQVENARIFEKAGAAISLVTSSTDSVTPEKFAALIADLAEDPEKRKAMGEAKIIGKEPEAKGTETKDAAACIAEEIVRRINFR